MRTKRGAANASASSSGQCQTATAPTTAATRSGSIQLHRTKAAITKIAECIPINVDSPSTAAQTRSVRATTIAASAKIRSKFFKIA